VGKGKKLLKTAGKRLDKGVDAMTHGDEHYGTGERRGGYQDEYRDDYREREPVGLPDRVLTDLRQEADRMPSFDPRMPDDHRLVLLMQQVGDVAAALTGRESDSERLYRALLRAAVLSCAWAGTQRRANGRRDRW
jgi:hypothetical protein